MSAPSPVSASPARRRALLALVLLAPWVVPAFVSQLSRLPSGPDLIELKGTWSWARTRDATAWSPVKLPGFFPRLGVVEPEFWVKRTFTWDPSRPGELWQFVAGNTRVAVMRVYVNGTAVGEFGAFDQNQRTDFNGLDAVTFSRAVLRPGDNELELHVRSETPNFSALADRRLLLGPSSQLSAWYASTLRVENFLRHAPLLAFALLSLLLLVLWRLSEDATERRLIGLSIGVLASSGAYLLVLGGIGLTEVLTLKARSNLVLPAATLSSAFFVEFVVVLFLGNARAWLVWANRVLAGAVVTLALSDIVLSAGSHMYRVYSAWALLALLLLLVVTAQLALALRTERDPARLLIAGAMATYLGTILVDLGTDVGLWEIPRLFALCLSNAPILTGVVVVTRFIGLAERNKQLSFSLATANAELGVALDEARAATRVKGEFLANVSHELRTPLNSIINIPEGLLEDFTVGADGRVTYGGDPADAHKYLTTLHSSGRHLLGVVNQVLDFSKLEAGRMTLHAEAVSVGALVAETIATLEALAGRRGITLKAEGALDAKLEADAVKVAQVLLNLGNNAVKFSPDRGQVTFTVEVNEVDVAIRVRDQGLGIAPEHQAMIFEGFRQVEGGATRRFGGTGLGLAISKKLVELHGGGLGLESAEGQGSTFVARFPLRPVELLPSLTQSTGRRCIVVVDDEPSVHETLRLSLRGLTVDVISVDDPRRAWATIEAHRPSVVVLDVMMPRLSGLTLLRVLRESPLSRAWPVVVLSAYSSNRETVERLGATFVAKPWNAEVLAATLRRLVGDTQGVPRNENV